MREKTNNVDYREFMPKEPIGLRGIVRLLSMPELYSLIDKETWYFTDEAFMILGDKVINELWSLGEQVTYRNSVQYTAQIQCIKENIAKRLRKKRRVYQQVVVNQVSPNFEPWSDRSAQAKDKLVGTAQSAIYQGYQIGSSTGKRGTGRYSKRNEKASIVQHVVLFTSSNNKKHR